MAIVYYDVGDGHPFAAVQNAIDAIPGNLLGLGEQRVRVYPGGVQVGDGYFYGERIDLDTGFNNESAADFVSVHAMVNHNGQRDRGIILDDPDAGGKSLIKFGPWSQVYGLCVTSDPVAGSLRGLDFHTVGNCLADSCVIYDIVAIGINTAWGIFGSAISGPWTVRNCAVINVETGWSSYGIYMAGAGGCEAFNCSVQGITDLSGMGRATGFHIRTNNAVVKNCIATDAGAAAGVQGDYTDNGNAPTVEYCISSDGTADDWGGAGNQINKDSITDVMFTSITAGAQDLHILDGSCAKDAGVDLSSEGFDNDFDGGTRRAPWDIGADEWGVPSVDGMTPDLGWEDEDDMFDPDLNPKLEALTTDTMPATSPVSSKYRIRTDISMPADTVSRRPPDAILDNLKDGHNYKYRLDTGDSGEVFVIGSHLPELEKKGGRMFLDGGKRRLDR